MGDRQKKKDITNLRRNAEEYLSSMPDNPVINSNDVEAIIHELKVHQFELEVQNEELRQTQIELEQARDRYHDLYEFAPVGYFTLSKGNFIQQVNLTGSSLLGVPREKLLKRRFSAFIDKQYEDNFYFHMKEVLETGRKRTCELKMVMGNGERCWMQIETVPIGDEVRIAVLDISERKKLEDRLAYLASFPELNPTLVIELDRQGNVNYLNTAARETFPDLETAGSKHPFLANLVQVILSQLPENSYITYEVKIGQRCYEQKIHRLKDSGRIRIYGYDVTDRKQAEEKALELEKLATIGLLAGNISHELRNPLGVIDSSAYYIVRQMNKYSDAIPESLYSVLQLHFERIRTNVERCTMVIENLLRTIQMRPTVLHTVDLKKVASEAISRNWLSGTAKIVRNFPEEPVLVSADDELLLMAFGNLVTNARQAMPDTGTLTVEIAGDGNQAVISFTDTGKGIAPEDVKKIFEPLFTTKAKGIGLGLTITRMVIERHGGKIQVMSEPGHGTTMQVCLPYKR